MESEPVRNLADLYEQYSGAVFRYLLYLTGERVLADELTGETFYRAILALDSFRGEASLKTWFLRIAHNLYLKNAAKNRPLISLEALEDMRGTELPAGDSDPEALLLGQERSHAIQRALLSLPESDRSILLLASQERLSCQEIGQVLVLSTSAVKVRLYRARVRFVASLVKEGVAL